jgi:hypothetical protein
MTYRTYHKTLHNRSGKEGERIQRLGERKRNGSGQGGLEGEERGREEERGGAERSEIG